MGGVHLSGALVLEHRAKGGDYGSWEVREPQVRGALVDYVTTSGMRHVLKTDVPLRTPHDRAGGPGRR